jgi:hypothetical protein
VTPLPREEGAMGKKRGKRGTRKSSAKVKDLSAKRAGGVKGGSVHAGEIDVRKKR